MIGPACPEDRVDESGVNVRNLSLASMNEMLERRHLFTRATTSSQHDAEIVARLARIDLRLGQYVIAFVVACLERPEGVV